MRKRFFLTIWLICLFFLQFIYASAAINKIATIKLENLSSIDNMQSTCEKEGGRWVDGTCLLTFDKDFSSSMSSSISSSYLDEYSSSSDFMTYESAKYLCEKNGGVWMDVVCMMSSFSSISTYSSSSYANVEGEVNFPDEQYLCEETGGVWIDGICQLQNFYADSNFSSSSSQSGRSIDLNSNIEQLKEYLYFSEGFVPSGIFTPYDFPGVDEKFDWIFVTPNNNVYQLQGNPPNEINVFGWKEVGSDGRVCLTLEDWSGPPPCEPIIITPDKPVWIMIQLGDWDNDGDERFDWLLFMPPKDGGESDKIYKLDGVTEDGSFRYKKIDDFIVWYDEYSRKYVFGYKGEEILLSLP